MSVNLATDPDPPPNDEKTSSSLSQEQTFSLLMEGRRKCCYAFINLEWYLQEKLQVPLTVVTTGSAAEGITYNDIDRMYFRNDILVVPNDEFKILDHKQSLCLLSMEEEKCCLGFTRLKLREEGQKVDLDLFTQSSGNTYLSGQKLKQFLLEYDLRRTCASVEGKHGPAITRPAPRKERLDAGIRAMTKGETTIDLDLDIDLVSSVKCVGWPTQLNGFFSRMKKMGIEKEMVPPCLFVPVPHPSSTEPDIEFRFSFSLIERFLIQKWTTKQIECYHRTKEANFVDYEDEKGICSYMIKSAMFWLVENKSKEYWESKSRKTCHQDLLKSIYDMFGNKTFPNYFIPKQNLIGNYTDQQIEKIEANLLRQSEELIIIADKIQDLSMAINSEIVKFYSNQCKGYISENIRFCLQMYTRFDYVNSVLLEEVIKDAPFTNDPNIQQYIKIALTECLALYKLYDAFEDRFAMNKDNLIEESRQLLLVQPEYPSDLATDNSLTKFVLLGILYYIKKDRFWSLKCLMHAFDIKSQFDTLTWYHAAYPIHLPSSKNCKPPICFQNEIISLLWITTRPNDVCIFDAYGLCLYFLFRLTGERKYFKMLKETDDIFIWSSLTKFTLVELMEQIWATE